MAEREFQRTKGPVCGIENCRSRWYEEAEDGYLYCQNGHRKGGLVVGEDEDHFTTARRTKTRKESGDDVEGKHYKYFRGKPALDLYLKSLQLVLRHQVQSLIQTRHLPPELETVVLDLWTLRILHLENKVGDANSGYESQSQTTYAASATSDTEISESEGEGPTRRPKERKLKSVPNLLDTLALCYLGTLTLRLPITLGDIHTWATEGKMPYLRAIRLIPLPMRDKLNPSHRSVLEPNRTLKPSRLFATTNDVRLALQLEFGIQWPRLNAPLLLFRLLKDLALPLELYDATFRLAGILGYTLALPTNVGLGTRLRLRHLPEPQLFACLVVAVKLLYPFCPSVPITPKSASEPAVLALNWETWHSSLASLQQRTEHHETPHGSRIPTAAELSRVEEKDVFAMNGDELDAYMDFYLDAFVDEDKLDPVKNTAFQNALYQFFPVDRPGQNPAPSPRMESGPSQEERLGVVRSVHGDMKTRRVIGEDDDSGAVKGVSRPGSQYPVWRKCEELPEHARRFYEEVSKIAGFGIEGLVLAVFEAERDVERWQRGQRSKASQITS